MAIERYKLVYNSNVVLVRVVEVTNAGGVIRATPIVYTSSSPGFAALLS
mgnify:FL=1